MSKKSTYFLGILLVIVIGCLLQWYLCCLSGDTTTNEETTQEAVTATSQATKIPFSVQDDNGELSYEVAENFNFQASNYTIENEIPHGVDNGIMMIQEYLNSMENKELDITGYYTTDETNNSAYPNLGIARANSIKNYIASKGISPKYMNIFGALKEDILPDENNTYYGPVGFNILTRAKDSNAHIAQTEAECEAIKKEPIVLYFATAQASLTLTPEQRSTYAGITKCIDKLGAKVRIEGHTDNTGNAASNKILGQERADFVKKYLTTNGIAIEHITSISKGQDSPIAANDTKEGRAKNRRIVVTIY